MYAYIILTCSFISLLYIIYKRNNQPLVPTIFYDNETAYRPLLNEENINQEVDV